MGKLSCKNTTITQRIYVIQGLTSNLLGLPAITALELAVRVDAVKDTSTDSVKKEYPSVFQGLGNLGEAYEIQLKTGATPT